jgi:hypothetical protein
MIVQFDHLTRCNAELFRRFFRPIFALLQIQPSCPCSDSNPSHVRSRIPATKRFKPISCWPTASTRIL